MALISNVVRGDGAADRLLLLVHGRGADERDLEGLLSFLDPTGRYVAVLPRGPLPFPPGFEWFEIGEGFPKVAAETFIPALEALDQLVEEACAELGLERSTAVFGGFSQGAAMALALGLRRSERVAPAGILAMSGFLPEVDGLDLVASAGPATLVQHGTQDPLIPSRHGRRTASSVAERGSPVVFLEYPMGHQLTPESAEDAQRWLGAIAAGDRPSAPLPDEPPPPELAADGLIREVDTAAFDAQVLTSEVPVIVDFWAPWCAPCRSVAPVLEQMAAMRRGSYAVVKVNIDEEPVLAQRYGIRSIPMVALFRNGRLERSSQGAKPRQSFEAELGMLVIP
ncbi:MAG: thioredoxin [Acidimicrobiia bacterium]